MSKSDEKSLKKIHEKNLVLYQWFDTYTHRDMATYAMEKMKRQQQHRKSVTVQLQTLNKPTTPIVSFLRHTHLICGEERVTFGLFIIMLLPCLVLHAARCVCVCVWGEGVTGNSL